MNQATANITRSTDVRPRSFARPHSSSLLTSQMTAVPIERLTARYLYLPVARLDIMARYYCLAGS